MKRISSRTLVFAVSAAAFGLSACGDTIPSPLAPSSGSLSTTEAIAEGAGRYLIIGAKEALPANLAATVESAGGTLVSSLAEIGVAVAVSSDPGFTARLAALEGVESVTEDLVIDWVAPQPEDEGVSAAEAAANAGAAMGEDETFYSFQWAPRAIQAPEAWGAGYTGRGVRVAVLDGAVFDAHIDLTANVDRSASRSFIPPTVSPAWDWNRDIGTFWHGTHVAGIIAAADNGVGTIGIAPEATLIGVKVLHNGSGAFEWIMNGIMYAARPVSEGGAGAHVINMSLGATLDAKAQASKPGVRELKKAIDRATKYAYQNGVTVIASAGNGATNFDDAKTLLKIPAHNDFVISVSATGPMDWARGNTEFSRMAYYTDHGKSLVDVAAPGGNYELAAIGRDFGTCTVTGAIRTITNRCYIFDGVMSTVRGTSTGNYNWAQGTSMAAPATAAVAALIIQRNGGTMSPAQVEMALRRSASDLGKRGKDEFYGHGWINAFRAVTQ